jgi:hypothetical protein
MCFSLGWLESLLINIVILAVVIGILKLLIPWVFGLLGVSSGPLMAVIQWIIIGIVAIFVIITVFQLLGCLGGFHGFHLAR